MDFRVQLDVFRGPLDLLLYLVRKHELETTEIPLAKIAEQFLEYLEVLTEIDVNAAGDFLELASTLVEIKSRQVLPQTEEEAEAFDDPREELVARLLEYKKYRDAASLLEDRSRGWQMRYGRLADDLPPRRIDPADQPIHEVELWDLVSAFGRIVREAQAVQPANIRYDETPIQVYMQAIHARLVRERRVQFTELFQPGMHKSALIGVFLAVLELVRHHRVLAEQPETHGEIVLAPGDGFHERLDLTRVDNYDGGGEEEPPAEEAKESTA